MNLSLMFLKAKLKVKRMKVINKTLLNSAMSKWKNLSMMIFQVKLLNAQNVILLLIPSRTFGDIGKNTEFVKFAIEISVELGHLETIIDILKNVELFTNVYIAKEFFLIKVG